MTNTQRALGAFALGIVTTTLGCADDREQPTASVEQSIETFAGTIDVPCDGIVLANYDDWNIIVHSGGEDQPMPMQIICNSATLAWTESGPDVTITAGVEHRMAPWYTGTITQSPWTRGAVMNP